MATIRPNADGRSFTLDVKRCYLPFTVTSNCPTCGDECVRDLDDDYLSYPGAEGRAH